MSESYDVIIIGAGIIGAATALALGRAGRRALSLDKLPAAGYGSTGASCAIIRPYYSTVDGSALAYESHFYWRDWAEFLGVEDERGLVKYHDCGCLVLKTEANGYLARACEIMDEIGAPYEHLSPEQVQARLPVTMESFAPAKRPDDPGFGEPTGDTMAGGVLFPSGGYISDPQLATHNLQRAAEANGAAFRFNAEVAAIRRAEGRVAGVTLAGGEEIPAPVVVNIAGPHSFKINTMAGVEAGMKIKTRALRHEVAHVPSPAGFDFEKDGCVFSDSDTGVYSRPELGNYVLVGSEDPECDERHWVDPDDYNTGFSEQWQVQVMRFAQRFPDLRIPNQTKGVVDLYDVTDDWIPIYDKSDLPGFYMAVGTSGNQFKNAPIAGEMMAELIAACEGGRDHDRDPVSFHLRYVDRDLNLGFFSRLREVNPDSSFSVLG
ncbi:MAG: FAD-binding oxidoreductase [Proteobacteria bacterium]|nr:FAD-binding oxidoreductase [Pseudomonadota bacterium]